MKSRPVQYAGLALLLLASLAIIFFPIGPKPEPQDYVITLTAPKPFKVLAGAKNAPADLADTAFNSEFSKNTEVLPGALTVGSDGETATVPDRATTRQEADDRANRILKALSTPFKGIELSPDFETELEKLPVAPLFNLGSEAVFPVKDKDGYPIPAVKLGLDLQGGVNLVLQVRSAQFTYTTTANSSNPTLADALLQQVRDALNATDPSIGLHDSDVSFDANSPGQVDIRTQAKDSTQFDAQTSAIDTALKAIKGAGFTQAAKPEFYVPQDSASQKLGYGSSTASQDVLNKTVEIIRSRVDKLGVSEPLIQSQGTDRIIVQLPGVNDPQKAVAVVGQTARMEIRLLPEDLTGSPDPKDPENVIFTDKQGNIVPNSQVRQQSELILTGADLKPNASLEMDESGNPAVSFTVQGDGEQRFAQVTAQVAGKGRQIPIFLDDRCIESPDVKSRIDGEGEITGSKSVDDARNLALLLNSGALPAPIDVVQDITVSASLGTDSLVKSLQAGLIGILAVALFMVVFYRIPGVLANVALMVYCVLNLGVFVLVGGTLTLPGIAGFVLAIAMSLDTNILVFERLKEEMVLQPTYSAALRAAFARAWTAILDSHVTTLIAAVVLFQFGTGPVKGFALTLGIGVLLSLFSAISVTRLFMWTFANYGETHRNLFAGKLPDKAVVTAQHKPGLAGK